LLVQEIKKCERSWSKPTASTGEAIVYAEIHRIETEKKKRSAASDPGGILPSAQCKTANPRGKYFRF